MSYQYHDHIYEGDESRFGIALEDEEYSEEYAEIEKEYRLYMEKGADIYERIKDQNLQRFMPESQGPSFMYYIFSALINRGFIKSGYFVRMRYEVITGREWQLVSGDVVGQGPQACVSHLGYTGQTAKQNWNVP